MTTNAIPMTGAEAPPVHAAKLTWWLGAGLVGADIGTSVFYSTGVLFPHVGFAAPLFVLFVVLTMWCFKIAYQEGCSVNPVNGGAYTMVLQTVGRRAALVVGSLTILSYLATAVVSALSGSLYLATLWSDPWPPWAVVGVAAVPVVGFAILNLWGLKESTKLVFGIAAFHFVMLIAMDVWGLWLAFTHGAHWERLWQGLHSWPGVTALPPEAMLLGFAAAFLGITGFESAAQIIEEIEQPTSASIRKIYLVIVALVSFTSPISSVLCLVLLSEAQITQYQSTFMSGLAVVEGGHTLLVLLVLNACLTLFAAVNTAFAGATGLMTTMGKQGNLPAIVLERWVHKSPVLKGYPYVALSFMCLCLVMLVAFPGSVDRLGEVYGMAFLAVMVCYCAGVILLRLHQPAKVSRSPYISAWTFAWRGRRVPVAALIGMVLLAIAELTLLMTAHNARDLGLQLFLAVLLIMAFYRLGQIEQRMVKLPDLRLGLGKYRKLEPMPELPTFVVCATGVQASRLVTLISYVMKKFGEDIEIVVFHAEEQKETHGLVTEGLERLMSQQLEEFYEGRDIILSMKVLPGNLVEVLPEYTKTRAIQKIFITSGHDFESSESLRNLLANEMDVEVVRLDEAVLPKGPGVWFNQWTQGFRHRDRNWQPEVGGAPRPQYDSRGEEN